MSINSGSPTEKTILSWAPKVSSLFFFLYFVFLYLLMKCNNDVFIWNSDGAILQSASGDNRKSALPEKENRYYTTRGSAEDNGKGTSDVNNVGEIVHACLA
ncbi:hypothetical protein TSUD_377430 [Trifolium subterraneum]|uniref:Uncharacterized protein n=1 Tax=Trifolium subterraneum TaxID=3900 RepID=A0A2Z6LGL9_TRISU|nr:hypothetical protein TSUD_377430 [Trifolium subterraneum]